MFLAVLRGSGGTLDFTAALAAHGLKADLVWEAGELDAAGRTRRDRGFNLTVADASQADDLTSQVRRFLTGHAPLLQDIRSAGGALTLDVGVTVGTDDQHTASVHWEPGDLALLADSAIELQFSAYPAN